MSYLNLAQMLKSSKNAHKRDAINPLCMKSMDLDTHTHTHTFSPGWLEQVSEHTLLRSSDSWDLRTHRCTGETDKKRGGCAHARACVTLSPIHM